ncbi:S8 family serine peptidase [Saccharibacillus alkalitolerans]|uniref:S8 family serine peptidase n=1 Tax=Saccharibacillus alkalitolerans TaxID=2705290 RepID=A0ABX0F320_9BACL|nr:S8 family serine peptidase [Saccharibacillus alkalitolerans]NGZ75316.1 S8 family serine peptidase [Saccharibacillus alkalitolerans]
MKKISSVILSLSLALGTLPAAASAKPSTLPQPAGGGGKVAQQTSEQTVESAASSAEERVIVTFKDKADKGLVEQAKGRVNQEFRNIPALAVSIPAAAIQGLKNNPNIESIEIDQPVRTEQTQDWGISKTKAPSAWTSGYTGKGVKVAVIDTGIAAHEDLAIAGGASVVSYTSSYSDDNGHGTHVAGIIGALNNGIGTVGIAPDASLYAVKALDQNGSGYLSDVVAGIDWSITNQMNIVNLSLGATSDSFSLKQVVDKAYAQGILVVAAAGNNGTADGSGDTVNYPARYDSAIAVAAVDSADQRGSFSATGSAIEAAAPGVNVLSTYLGNQYVKMSGTSMAAPYVAGDLALLKQAYPSLTHVELRAKLAGGVIDLGAAGRDNWFGYGLIQAPQSTGSQPAPAPAPAPTLETKTFVSTNKSSYRTGETVAISVKATDSAGIALQGATVSLTVTNPKGTVATAQATTGSSGTASFSFPTGKSSVKGTYQVKAAVSLSNYTGSSASTSFQLR